MHSGSQHFWIERGEAFICTVDADDDPPCLVLRQETTPTVYLHFRDTCHGEALVRAGKELVGALAALEARWTDRDSGDEHDAEEHGLEPSLPSALATAERACRMLLQRKVGDAT